MSKTGSKPIVIPDGVTVTLEGGKAVVKGKLATITVPMLMHVKAEMADKNIQLSVTSDIKQARANWGTMGAHLRNAITGVTEGFKKQLDIQGIGFKAAMKGNDLVLNLGFSHPIEFKTPEGIKITVEKNVVNVTGSDRYLVGQVAAKIRSFKKPEPYQGKGIRYVGEQVRRKAGKKVAGATAA
jgi:large subunit ribosomal protein L6